VTASEVVTPLKGIQDRSSQMGIKVVSEVTDNAKNAAKLASESDLTVVVAATTSREEYDRSSLSLDNDADALIGAVAKVAKRIVVIIQAPGAVLMPWRDTVDGIALMFLGGQETGSAWASILFGDHAPTGHLPIMIPETENDAIPPSNEKEINYSEGLATSYRNPNFTAAFPFGHGLTYSDFSYSPLQASISPNEVHIRTEVSNVGHVAAATVAQLYIGFPPSAQYPSALLKGFNKTALIAPGQSIQVAFKLTNRDLSYYTSAGWTKAKHAVVHVGVCYRYSPVVTRGFGFIYK